MTTSRNPSKHIQDLYDRALLAHLPAEIVMDDDDFADYVTVTFSNGRSSRQVSFDDDDAQTMSDVDLASIVFLSDFNAFANRSTGMIEASVTAPGTPLISGRNISTLAKLPGVEPLPAVDSEEAEIHPSHEGGAPDLPRNWRLRLESPDGTIAVELGPASDLFRAFFWGTRVSLKIWGVDLSTHDAAVKALERYGKALLFDLDVVYGVVAALSSRRTPRRRTRRPHTDKPPSFPLNRYSTQSLALYEYGRSASTLPLLEFLAYYQSVEYFFPFYAREQAVNSLRSTLMDPRFDPSDEVSLSRVLDVAANGGRSIVPERDQLRATVRACVHEAELAEFFDADSLRREHLFNPKQNLRGVQPLREGKGAQDLLDQVAERIYSIRCRIVHTKQDGAAGGVDVLLPYSREAASLGPEVDLVRLVAQRALISRASRG